MTRHRMRERRKRSERQRRQERLFAEAVLHGAVIMAPPAVCRAIERDSKLVAGIDRGGVSIYSNPYIPPGWIVAIAPDFINTPIPNDPMFQLEPETTPYRFRILW